MLELVHQPVTFRVSDACAYLGISEYLLWKLVRERRIAHIRAGKLLLFRKAALDDYLAGAEAHSVATEHAPLRRIRSVVG